jgi:hypothetical protein
LRLVFEIFSILKQYKLIDEKSTFCVEACFILVPTCSGQFSCI